MTLSQFFDDFYRPLRLRGRSANTARLYGCTIRAFGRWLGREPVLEDLDELLLARYLEHRATIRSPFTSEKERTQLTALAGLAWERRLLAVKPIVLPSPLPERVPFAWSVEDMGRLIAAAEALTASRDGVILRDYFPALLMTLWETGERIGAIRDTLVEDYKRPHLVVRAECRKGRRRDRVYPLSESTCDRLDVLASRESVTLFRWPFCSPYLWRYMKRLVAAAGLGNARRMRFHQVRRTAASHLAAAGGDPVAFLDHSSPKITKRWYLDPRVADRGARACDILPKIAAPA